MSGRTPLADCWTLLFRHVCGSGHWDGYRRVMEGGESRCGHGVLAVPGIAKDGRRLSLEFTIVALRDGSGGLIGLAAIMRDVTERFEETRALKRKLAEISK
jgi:PAS domain S-box-containing protein